jgi:CubicO group peptidase (beta-lactamase class C family)
MSRSSDKFGSGDAVVFAFQAGNDMLVTSSNVNAALRKMKKLLRKEKEFMAQLDRSVKKILGVKYDAGLSQKAQKRVSAEDPFKTKILSRKMYRAAITVLSNERNTLPVQTLEGRKFVSVIADDSVKGKVFSSRLSKYIRNSVIVANGKTDTLNLTDTLRFRQVVIVALFPESKESTFLKLLPAIRQRNPNREVIVCDFGAPFFKNYAQQFPSVIIAYSDDRETLVSVAEVIFGGLPAEGISPITWEGIPPGRGLKTGVLDRLTYSFPEEVGMDGKTLGNIEAIAKEAIETGATPGCHVLIAKDGKVIYERSFGHLTYEKQDPVTDQTIYDLASVTKVSATLQAIMFLHDRGMVDINKKASVYLPELKNSNKKDFILKDILTHQAGLWPFLPFWAQTVKDTVYLPQYYSRTLSADYPLVVSDNLFASRIMKDSLWSWIVKAKIREKPDRTPFDYRYSDMGFYIGQHLSERLLNQPMEDFLDQNLYEPLGASTTGYLPLLKFPIHQIAPTENDKFFRKALLIGTVHDQGAAMQGGVAGHAGLFSNANDLAKLGQMLLQEGYYGGTRYYRPETVRFFTQKQFENSRRGLGWDKPEPGDWNGPTSYTASLKTFGHTGFTGTCIWIDPEFKVVYIFLSNRVHPDMTNNKLLSANIRSRIQDVIYQSIFNYCKTAGGEPQAPENTVVEAFGKSQ